MSTNKTKDTVKSVKKNNAVAKPAGQVQKTNDKEVPQAPQKKDTPDIKTVEKETKHFYLGCVLGLKYVINSYNHNPIRKIKTLLVWADHDLVNEPETFRQEMDSARGALLNDGYYLTEEDALVGLTFTVGDKLSSIAHDLEYNEDDCPCKDCTRGMLMDIESVLKLARDNYYRHRDLQMTIPDASNVPVFPNPEDMDKFEVRSDGQLYLKNPPKNYKEHSKYSFGVIKPDDLPKELRDAISKFIADRAKKDK